MKIRCLLIICLTLLANLVVSSVSWAKPLVIAHRGASGYLPEHTLESKALAYGMGADYIEQDVIMTKDDKLIVFHDLTLDATTDVAQKYPNKHRANGRYYVIDFTLAELQQLNVSERTKVVDLEQNKTSQTETTPTKLSNLYPNRFPHQLGEFKIHTLAQEIELIKGLNRSTGKNVGIYPEIKAPWFHRQEGKDISFAVLKQLKHYGYTKQSSAIFLQSFDANELKRIKNKLFPQLQMNVKLVQLIAETNWQETFELKDGKWQNYSYDWMFQDGGMSVIAGYANGIGPWKSMLISDKSTKQNLIISSLVKDAHNAGLTVHPYTFRADPNRIPIYADSFESMIQIFANTLNIDGLFTDFPDKALNALSGL